MSEWRQTSIYLTGDDQTILQEIVDQTGLSRSEVVRRAVRKMHREGDYGEDRDERLREIADELKRLA